MCHLGTACYNSMERGAMFSNLIHHFLLAISVLILFPDYARASAWVQPRAQAEFTLNNFYYETAEFYDLNGQKQDQGLFTKYAIKPYIEYGLTDRWTVVGSLELQRVKQKQVGIYLSKENPGVADPEVFARYHLFDWKDGTFSIEPSVKFMSHFRDNRVPKGGTSSMEYGVALLHGQNFSLFGQNHYTDLRLEYVKRVAGLEDQYIAELRTGLSITDSFRLIPGVSMVKSVDLPQNQAFVANGDIDYDLYKAELNSEYDIANNLTLIAGGNLHVGGKNTGAGGGVNIGFRTRF